MLGMQFVNLLSSSEWRNIRRIHRQIAYVLFRQLDVTSVAKGVFLHPQPHYLIPPDDKMR